MRIVIDIDGTICELKKEGQTYSDVKVIPGAVEKIQALKDAGHYIILQTARHMKTCNGDQGQVIARVGKITLDWLEKNNIPYDEIHFGKPNADLYIDDLAHRFSNWEDIDHHNLNNDKINILIPMAGAGSRFVEANYDKPKPLIDVHNEPMIKWAVKSIDFIDKLKNFSLIFIILKEHDEKHGLKKQLKEIFSEYKDNIEIVIINEITRGQAETCLAAKNHINNYNKLIIHNCDTYSTSNIFDIINEYNPDGILPCFESDHPRYSFAKTDEHNNVIETAEKNPISNNATNGTYYFKRGLDFVQVAENAIRNNEFYNNEFYIAPLYNKLIKSGKKIKIAKTKLNHVLGTPEELNNFLILNKNNNL